ncbi:MAG: response regulator, partial [Deltaproteobacteria bacterium]|nr:response regulator [Deltaproteobacteria bacterium]
LSKGTETILLVDDEDIITDAVAELLEQIGYKVFWARSGREALSIYKSNKDKIHLVILDIIMPDILGGETFDRLREINPEIKVLLSSGYSLDGQATEIMDRGCNSFIQKPFNIKELSVKIREVLDAKDI